MRAFLIEQTSTTQTILCCKFIKNPLYKPLTLAANNLTAIAVIPHQSLSDYSQAVFSFVRF
jgi:hypothetical protein